MAKWLDQNAEFEILDNANMFFFSITNKNKILYRVKDIPNLANLRNQPLSKSTVFSISQGPLENWFSYNT